MQLTSLNSCEKWPLLKPVGKTFFITCMLKGAVPRSVIRDIEKRFLKDVYCASQIPNKEKSLSQIQYLRKRYVQTIDLLLDDRKIGPHYLQNPVIASLLEEKIQEYNGIYYHLVAHSILPNHFHMLIDTSIQLTHCFDQEKRKSSYATLDQITKKILSETEGKIAKVIGRVGPIWELKVCDLMVTKGEMMEKVTTYILNNTSKKACMYKVGDQGPSYAKK